MPSPTARWNKRGTGVSGVSSHRRLRTLPEGLETLQQFRGWSASHRRGFRSSGGRPRVRNACVPERTRRVPSRQPRALLTDASNSACLSRNAIVPDWSHDFLPLVARSPAVPIARRALSLSPFCLRAGIRYSEFLRRNQARCVFATRERSKTLENKILK